MSVNTVPKPKSVNENIRRVKTCLVCDTAQEVDLNHLANRCPDCNFYYMQHSDLRNKIENDDAVVMADFRSAIHGIREKNFGTILKEISKIRALNTLNCLDVGCAYGHFLSLLKVKAKSAIGIEPNDQMRKEAEANGVSVIPGFFPEDLPTNSTYDLISFNDVLEHLPDPKAALEACFDRLSPGGLLLISIPSSDGIVFKISGILNRLNLGTLNDRIWQRQFYTPHISYFNRRNLSKLALNCGFTTISTKALPVVESKSLYKRISVDNSLSTFRKLILSVCGTAYAISSMFMPEEYFFTVFKKEDKIVKLSRK